MKILIWDKDFLLKDTGGPSGYLYNIHEYLKQNPIDEIIFYSDVLTDKSVENSKLETLKRTLLGKIPLRVLWGKIIRRLIHKSFRNVFRLFQVYYTISPLSEEEINLMNSVDYVHFHMLSSVLHYYPYFKNIKAKTILTTHTPEPNIMEIEGAMPSVKKLTQHKWIKNKIIERESVGYKSVDYIMLPVPTAQEVYISNCTILEQIFNRIQNKIFYVTTAIQETFLIDEEKNKKYEKKLSSFPFKVCFIGRHNQIKGYDKLQDIARICWQKNSNITFVIGGEEKPLTRLNDPRWIELGWVNTNALLKNIDMFILPNKQTYFDLILLEVMRQGIPCVISNTGGNKWFINKRINGIYGYEYDNVDDAVKLIIQLSHKVNSQEWAELKNNCLDEFNTHYTMKRYIDSYLGQIKCLTEYEK